MNIIEVTGNPHHDQLVHLITECGHMNIGGLAQLLDVSTQTARRDTRKLSEWGLIIRHHGEVRRVSSVMNIASEQRELPLTVEERATTEAATDYLPKCCTVSIATGTTIEAVTRALSSRHDLCTITGSPHMAQTLYKNQDIEVVVPGGTSRARSSGTVGPGVVDFIRGFRADYLVTSIGATEHDSTLLEFDVNEALVAKAMIKHAQNTLLVASNTKFVVSATISIDNARNVRVFFTDAPPPSPFCRLLSEENVELVVAKQEVP